MRTNFHTHTFRCRHAQGTEREMIEAALQNDYSDLGFSDHTPWPFVDDYDSACRMHISSLNDYLDTINALKAEYAGRIRLHLGLECEYYPCFEGWMRELKQQHGLYYVLGNHFDTCEPSHYFGNSTTPEQINQYLKMTIAGMETGLYVCLAHPDLFLRSYETFDSHCRNACRELCRAANALNMPVEYNILGARRGRGNAKGVGLGYTTPEFWEIAAEENVTCILGVDAHEPAHIQDAPFYDQCAAYLDGLGLRRVTML